MNLNLIDIDFLESMGMPTNKPIEQKPTKKATQQIPEKKIANDPSAILAKLNDKNSQFISAYNLYAMNTREQ